MIQPLRHESFYAAGEWSDESLGAYVGWVERSGGSGAAMPICDERGDVSLIFSGEDFSDLGVQRGVPRNGHGHASSKLSYLIDAYNQSPEFPKNLNGRFQGLLADRVRATVTLFNDRYGMHRLYYSKSKEAFYFAAEAKAILAVRPESRRINSQNLAELVACGCVLENRTIFDGIQVLPPGSAWVFCDGELAQKKTYFDPEEWEEQTTLEPEAYYQSLREVFSRQLPRYFNGCQPVGMSLTGGLDTRMILAWLNAQPDSLPCYSFGGTYRDSQDVAIGRRLAKTIEQPFEVIPVGNDFLSKFARYAERTVYLTDGCVEVNHTPDLYVNERAREIAPVRMTGNYGSEVLRRVRAFKPVPPAEGLFESGFNAQIGAVSNSYRAQLDAHPLSFAVFRQAPWHHYGLLALEESQLSLRSPFLDNDLVQTVFRAPQSALATSFSLRLIADGSDALARIPTDRGYVGYGSNLLHSLSHQYLELTAKAEYAYDYGMPQWVAKADHLLAPFHVEKLFLGRHKFYHFRVWYRDALSDYIREMLLDERTLSRPYLQRQTAESIVKGHMKGNENFTSAIHKILTLELIHRLFVDAN
jgi:asparagine synthase (glutamine-hydrolysing)